MDLNTFRQADMWKHALPAMLQFLLCLGLQLSTVAFAQPSPPTYVYPLDPKATYLRTSEDPDAVAPSLIRFFDLELTAGDVIQLRSAGKATFCVEPSCGPFSADLIAAFTNDENPPNLTGSNVVPAGPPVVTMPTWFDSLSTDVVGDFEIPAVGVTVVRIPPGAVALWVVLHDRAYSDNSTPETPVEDHLAVTLTPGCPAPGIPAGAGSPYVCFAPGLTQALYATAPGFFGGIAFAPDEDLLVSFCDNRYFPDTPTSLRRFDAQSTTILNGSSVHPQVPGSPFASLAGCGLVNDAAGNVYSNTPETASAVVRLDPNTGAVLAGPFGGRGNGLGIARDPQTGNLVYVGYESEILFISPDGATSGLFSDATRDATAVKVIDGIFFEPTGAFLFLAQFPQTLIVMNRAGEIVQNIHVSGQPDGIAFHATSPRYVVTNNVDGTLTRLDFPGDDYSSTPTQTLIASGGFRGDISQVGPDGCLYVPMEGTRFADGTISDVLNVGSDNSAVQICGGFAPVIDPPSFPDSDGDGVADSTDNAPGVYNPIQTDRDHDGVGDTADNCPQRSNADQLDANGDDLGDACSNPVSGETDYRESLALPTGPRKPGEPIWITATFTNTSGADLVSFRPDCTNTVVTVTTPEGTILDPIIKERIYAIPRDVVTIPNNGNFAVTCDLAEMFAPSQLRAGSPRQYQVQATYANHATDPFIVNGLCTVAQCVNLWIGAVTSAPQTLTIDGERVVKPIARVNFSPTQWALSGEPTVWTTIDFSDTGHGPQEFDPSTIRMNGSVPIIPGSASIAGNTLTVRFNGTAASRSVGTTVEGANVLAVVQGANSARTLFFTSQRTVSLVNAIGVAIDIKPGGYPNSINLGSNGVVPVAILSTASFDARSVDPATVTLAGAHVQLKGRGAPMASIQDVNGDGKLDLVVHVSTEALQITASDSLAVLRGKTSTGDSIIGLDSIRIVP